MKKVMTLICFLFIFATVGMANATGSFGGKNWYNDDWGYWDEHYKEYWEQYYKDKYEEEEDDDDYSYSVPEPNTMLLLVAGMIGMVGFRKRFKK